MHSVKDDFSGLFLLQRLIFEFQSENIRKCIIVYPVRCENQLIYPFK